MRVAKKILDLRTGECRDVLCKNDMSIAQFCSYAFGKESMAGLIVYFNQINLRFEKGKQIFSDGNQRNTVADLGDVDVIQFFVDKACAQQKHQSEDSELERNGIFLEDEYYDYDEEYGYDDYFNDDMVDENEWL